MKIEGTPPLRRIEQRPARKATAASADFATALTGLLESVPAASTAAAGAAPTVGAAGTLLAVQQAEDALARRRQARSRAETILDALDELHRGLLADAIPRRSLEALIATLKARRPEIEDARLAAVLDEIDLRAQVELAKLDRNL